MIYFGIYMKYQIVNGAQRTLITKNPKQKDEDD